MSSNGLRRESPVIDFEADSQTGRDATGVRMEEKAFLGHVNLRGNPQEAAFRAGTAAALGFDLPAEANTFTSRDGVSAAWLGPDEWLINTGPGEERGIVDRLRGALEGVHAAVTDVTGGQTVLNLSGAHVREVLAKGCSLDLHPPAFRPGSCAQSNLAKAVVTILQLDDSPSYDVIVRRSFAMYLARWIEDAASEYGLEVA